jgi:hypothetical protein
MGYNTLNGASATAISALIKYGLLEGRGEEIKISDRAMRILHPQSPAEKAEAVRDAAAAPELFRELTEKFPGRMPTEEVVRSYLIRRGFAEAALSPVILAYRETNEFLEREGSAYDSAQGAPAESQPVQQTQQNQPVVLNQQGIGKPIVPGHPQRAIAQYPFENGGMLQIVVTGDIGTEEALDWAETLIELKRKEIARNASRTVVDEGAKKAE